MFNIFKCFKIKLFLCYGDWFLEDFMFMFWFSGKRVKTYWQRTVSVTKSLKSILWLRKKSSKVFGAKFPHSPILHYAYSPLLEENNSANNRLPLWLYEVENVWTGGIFESRTMKNCLKHTSYSVILFSDSLLWKITFFNFTV